MPLLSMCSGDCHRGSAQKPVLAHDRLYRGREAHDDAERLSTGCGARILAMEEWRSASKPVRIVSTNWRAWLKMRDHKRAAVITRPSASAVLCALAGGYFMRYLVD